VRVVVIVVVVIVIVIVIVVVVVVIVVIVVIVVAVVVMALVAMALVTMVVVVVGIVGIGVASRRGDVAGLFPGVLQGFVLAPDLQRVDWPGAATLLGERRGSSRPEAGDGKHGEAGQQQRT
jgi:hypothetical protein